MAVTSILERIRAEYPDPETFHYYADLFRGKFTFEQTMLAHLQDLARSIGARGGLREIQLEKLDVMLAEHEISDGDWQALKEAIEDELPAPGRPSHFDVRVQMFEDLAYDIETLESVLPLPPAVEATKRFRALFETCSMLEITASVGAIEEWYVPLASRLELCYSSLGYTARQVATYSLHKKADIGQS